MDNLPPNHKWTGPHLLRKLVIDMLQFDPNKRPKAVSVLASMETLVEGTGNECSYVATENS